MRLVACALPILLFAAASALAQAPFLVTDLNDGWIASSSSPEDVSAVGDRLYITADANGLGKELWSWKDDELSLIKDIYPGPSHADPSPVADIGGGIGLFSANDSAGRELWRTDGTSEGTFRVKDIAPGNTTSVSTTVHVVLGGKFVFAANDGVNGREPWISDGTADGTRMLVNLTGDAATAAAGQLLKSVTRTYAAHFFDQVASSVMLDGLTLTGGESITFQVTAGRVFIYGGTTDNTTNDPSMQLVVPN